MTPDAHRSPLPPFTAERTAEKVPLAEGGWTGRAPAKVAMAYATDSTWRNRAEFVKGRAEIAAFLIRKWAREVEYRLIKDLWAFDGNRSAVRYAYECTMTAAPGSEPVATRTGRSWHTA